VRADGTIGDVQVVRSLDRTFGLDDQAIRAVRQWQFAPGTRMGEPVAVQVTIELTFALR
jgi:TonB family protein